MGFSIPLKSPLYLNPLAKEFWKGIGEREGGEEGRRELVELVRGTIL
jgi:hypothetical protein